VDKKTLLSCGFAEGIKIILCKIYKND